MISGVKNYRHSLIGVSVAIWITIAAGVFLIFISSNRQLGFVSGIVFILVGLYPFVRAWMRREFDAFEIINMFVLYMLIQIGIRGIIGIKYINFSSFMFYDLDSEHFDILRFKVFAYSTIALMFLYLGYYSRLGNRWLNVLPRLNFNWDKTRIVICTVIYFIISEVALIVFTSEFGMWEGISSFGRDPSAIQGQAMYGGRAHIGAFFYFFWVLLYVSCIYWFSKKGTVWANITALFCLLQVTILFLHYGTKSSIMFAIMTYIITRHYLKRMISIRWYIVTVVGIFILFPSLWYFRVYGVFGSWEILKNIYISAFNSPVEFILPLVGRESGFDTFALFIDAIDSGARLELGATMASLLWFYIPRVWWPDKPLTFSVTFPEKYANVTVPGCNAPSLPGELYVNFHMVGVVMGFLLLGILMKLCYQCLIKRNQNNSGLLIYLPIVLYSPLILEAGTMAITDYLVALFPVILFLWFVKSKG